MDDRRLLMAACIANPDEDTPRLALADWLEEHGDKHDQARAEFIRLQIEAHKLRETDPVRKKLDHRAQKILAQHREIWLAQLIQLAARFTTEACHTDNWSRGFVSQLFMPTQTYLLKATQRDLPDTLARIGVAVLQFTTATKRLTALTDSPALRWVAGIITREGDDKLLSAFGQSPTCMHLSSIEFTDSKVTDAGLREFAESASTGRLRRFALPLDRVVQPRRKYTATGVAAVLESSRFPLLDTLDLSGIQQEKFDYDTLFASPRLNRLTRLQAGGNVPMALIAASPHLTALRELSVEDSRIDDHDVDILLANASLKQLLKLRLWETNAGTRRLSTKAEKKLRDRFGANLSLDYSYQCVG
jgi:uncharacterized protein (TIGR02996 family)